MRCGAPCADGRGWSCWRRREPPWSEPGNAKISQSMVVALSTNRRTLILNHAPKDADHRIDALEGSPEPCRPAKISLLAPDPDPGLVVQRLGLDLAPEGLRRSHIDVWARSLPGQYFHRVPLAASEVPAYLPVCFRRQRGRASWHRSLVHPPRSARRPEGYRLRQIEMRGRPPAQTPDRPPTDNHSSMTAVIENSINRAGCSFNRPRTFRKMSSSFMSRDSLSAATKEDDFGPSYR